MKYYKKIKFKLFLSFFFATGLLLSIVASSCSAFAPDETGGYITFSITGEITNKIFDTSFSRGVDDPTSSDLDEGDFLVEISLSGDYTEVKTVSLSSDKTVIFENIPIDSKIRGMAKVYKIQTNADGYTEKALCYKGESEEITIASGENKMNISLYSAGVITIEGISVTIDSTSSDINVTKTETAESIILLADEGYDSYSWTFEGLSPDVSEYCSSDSTSPNKLIISVAKLLPDNYDVVLTAKKGSETYSAFISIVKSE